MNGLDFGTAIGLIKGLGSPDPAVIEGAVTDWLADHPEATTTVQDGSITKAKLDSDLQGTVDDVANLKSQMDDYFIKGINLFNPNDPDLLENYKLNNDGTTTAETGKIVSGYIPVIPGATICVNYPTGTYGSASSLVLYNGNKERYAYVNPSRYVDSRSLGYLKYTFSQNTPAAFFRATGTVAGLATYMYVYANEMPSTYIPYTDKVTLSDDVDVPFDRVSGVKISKSDTDFVKPNPINLNDRSAMVVGVINNSNSNGDLDSTATNWYSTDYIPVEVGETYKLYVAGGVYYGSSFKGVCWYKADKTYGGHITPSEGIQTIEEVGTITIPADAAYIRVSYPKADYNTPKLWYRLMVTKVAEWSKGYLASDSVPRLQGAGLMPDYSAAYNCLYGKTAIWNGDSICAADNDSQGGWPFRIAAANGMYTRSWAIAGGCIAENVSASGGTAHSVCGTLDTMLAVLPNADYILIEGGTNDADQLGTNGIGTFDDDDFSAEYIAALDEDTFSGALESIFYRLVTTMKGKHIGYIIPQKMGHTAELVARRRTYFDRAIDICKKWGIPYLDLWNGLYFNWRLAAHWDQSMTSAENEAAGNLYMDGQHLTTTGYAIQSPIIAEWMKTI